MNKLDYAFEHNHNRPRHIQVGVKHDCEKLWGWQRANCTLVKVNGENPCPATVCHMLIPNYCYELIV